MATSIAPIILKETAAPATPPSGHVALYSVDGSALLMKDDAGAISSLGGGTTISALASAGTLDGTEIVPVVSGGVTDRTTTAEIAALGLASESAAFSQGGALTVKTGAGRYPIKDGTFTITSIAAMVNTAPTGATLIVDVNKNGTTIYGTQGNRPTVAISGTSATVSTHSVTTVTTGDYLTVDIDQVGSTVAGSDLVVVVRLQRTA